MIKNYETWIEENYQNEIEAFLLDNKTFDNMCRESYEEYKKEFKEMEIAKENLKKITDDNIHFNKMKRGFDLGELDK